jgi:selenophosphate synthetase-related protein
MFSVVGFSGNVSKISALPLLFAVDFSYWIQAFIHTNFLFSMNSLVFLNFLAFANLYFIGGPLTQTEYL